MQARADMAFESLWERSLWAVHLEGLVLRFQVPVVMRWNLGEMKRLAEEEEKCKRKRKMSEIFFVGLETKVYV